MSTLLPDGEYIIRSVPCPGSTLFQADPTKILVGTHAIPHQPWVVKNLGGNIITLRNYTFAPDDNEAQEPTDIQPDDPVAGLTSYKVQVHKSDGSYYFTSLDHRWIWLLAGCQNNAVVVYKPYGGKAPEFTRWKPTPFNPKA